MSEHELREVISMLTSKVEALSLEVDDLKRNPTRTLHNYKGQVTPGVNEDISQGFSVGSQWADVSALPAIVYACRDNSLGAAVWEATGTGVFVEVIGDTMTGTLNIEVATGSREALILKTTNDSTGRNLMEAKASDNSLLLLLDAIGNLGLGTPNPAAAFELRRSGVDAILLANETANTNLAGLRLRRGTNDYYIVNDAGTLRIVQNLGEGGETDGVTFNSQMDMEVHQDLMVDGKMGLGGNSPVTSTGWAFSNVSTDKVLDVDSFTLDELGDIVGTLALYMLDRGDIEA